MGKKIKKRKIRNFVNIFEIGTNGIVMLYYWYALYI